MSDTHRQPNVYSFWSVSDRLDVSAHPVLLFRDPSLLFSNSVADFFDCRWGCPPGWLCKPVLENCNFEAGLPDRNFLCSPNECVPAEVIPGTLPTWDADIYGNSTPATNPALRVNAIDSYFNMNPLQFGLSYEIFVVEETVTRTTTILEPPSPTMAARQAQTSIPGECYPWCNNCLLEAQSNGKTSKLCVPGSAFEVSLGQCEQCIAYHKSDDTADFVEIAPQFQQFLDYCDQFSTVVVSTTASVTTTNSAGSTYTTLLPILSTTVTPKASASQSSIVATLTAISSTLTATTAGSTSVSISSTLSTLSRPSSTAPASTPPAPTSTPPAPSSGVQPFTTTETVLTTTYSHTTVSGTAWSSITIIMPVGANSTTTLYGSTLTSGGATLVLPTSPVTSTYTTTAVITPSGQISAGATTAGPSSTASAPLTTFTGAGAATRPLAGDRCLRTIALGLAVCHILGMLFL
jgi:hypothetical protein